MSYYKPPHFSNNLPPWEYRLKELYTKYPPDQLADYKNIKNFIRKLLEEHGIKE